MRFLATLAFIVCMAGGGMNANEAKAWWGSYGGYWGAGYAPYYGGYYGAYRPYYGGYYRAAYYGAGYYGTSYGCSSCGCSPCSCSPCGCSPCGTSCCSPCGTGCGVGCATGCGDACGAVSSEKAGDPVRDPVSREGNGQRRRDYEGWRNNTNSDDESREDAEQPPVSPFDRSNRDTTTEDDEPDFLRNRSDSGRFGGDELDGGLGGARGLGDTEGGGAFGEEDDFLGREANKPSLDQPVDESAAPQGDEAPVPGAETAPEARLFRGMLSERQARTQHGEAPSRFRLAGYERGPRNVSAAQWSKKDGKGHRPVKWIGAPIADGRARF